MRDSSFIYNHGNTSIVTGGGNLQTGGGSVLNQISNQQLNRSITLNKQQQNNKNANSNFNQGPNCNNEQIST